MVRDLYIVGSILIWVAHKGICGRAGFSAVPAVFLVYLLQIYVNKMPPIIAKLFQVRLQNEASIAQHISHRFDIAH